MKNKILKITTETKKESFTQHRMDIHDRMRDPCHDDLNMHLDNLISFYGINALILLVNKRSKKRGAA